MSSIDALESQMTVVICSGLRDAMQHVNVGHPDPLEDVVRNLEAYLYDPLYDQVLETYTAGYYDGGVLIRRAGFKVDVSPLGDAIIPDDPLVAKMTEAAIAGLEIMLSEHKEEILAQIQAQIETGATMPQITAGLKNYFVDNPVAASRFARTAVTDISTRAHLIRYEDSGVVDGVEFSAHIDNLTSDTCQMLNGTIWRLGDPGIRHPPQHFNCRSDLLPYFGPIPGTRNFVEEFGYEFVENATAAADTFLSKYWSSMSTVVDSVKRNALQQELSTVRELIRDRCPVKPHHERTIAEVYSTI